MSAENLDEVGYWTEVKLSILHEYANAYATILNNQKSIKHFAYIDGFAGPGAHISKKTGEEIQGSPAVALSITPSFSSYHFIDLDKSRTLQLRQLTENRKDAFVYEGDCNEILLQKIFPQHRYEDYHRALCLLDPYGLNPDWEVVKTAGQMENIEIFLNFMIMDANMNVLWKHPEKVEKKQIERMNKFWGDDSWRKAAYATQPGLFEDFEEKTSNEAIAEAYRKRIQNVAGFNFVPKPMPMRNRTGAVIYYLYFASPNSTGGKIVRDIFKKYDKNREP